MTKLNHMDELVGEYQPLSGGLLCRACRSSTSPEPSVAIYYGGHTYYILLDLFNVSNIFLCSSTKIYGIFKEVLFAPVKIITYYIKSGIKSVAKQLLVPAIAIN